MKVKLMQALYGSDLKSRAILVMNYLIYRANKEGTCFPAIKTISRDCHVSINTVKRALDDLVKAGYVRKEARFIENKNGAQTSNIYTLSTGLFVDDDMEMQTEVVLSTSSASYQEAPIEQVTFEYKSVDSYNNKSIAKCQANPPDNTQNPAVLIIEPSDMKVSSYLPSKWAALQPIIIPP